MTHYSDVIIAKEIVERLAVVSLRLVGKAEQAGEPAGRARFNPYKWVQAASKKGTHPEAMLQALERLDREWARVLQPWAYLGKIIAVESGNKFERDLIKRGKTEKEELGMVSVGAGLAEMLMAAMEKGKGNGE